jgi:formylglycine-generating enzyme required for sulfatase activity
MRQSRTGLLLMLLIFTIAVSGQQGASSGNAPTDIIYARPGRLVDVGGFRLNLYCTGSGSPTVVFDSGWGDWSPAWSKVQPEIAKWTRACSYDRAGTGFSDPGPMPRTSVRIAKELRTALHRAGIAGPYILVGSAFGGDNVRTFAHLYMNEVAGLVLDDADPVDLEPAAMQEESHRGQAHIPADLRDCRNLIAGHKPLPAKPARPGRPPQTCAPRFFFRGLPEAEWSPELNAKLLEIAQTKVAMYDAYASEMEQTTADEIYLQQHHRSFGSLPIRVLTSGNHGVGHLESRPPDTPEHLKYEQETTAAQARWLAMSSNSKQIFSRNSSEYIQFDEPDTVINAIREVYDQAHSPTAKTSATLSGAAFRECSECPEMGIIPAGHFVMGSSDAEKAWAAAHGGSPQAVSDEAPQHEVTLPAFALGRYDVTRGEYAAFERATGHPSGGGCGHGRAIFKWEKDPQLTWKDPGFAQTDRDPVVCVTWNDAQAYVAWLNTKSGHAGAYHLPSESEWEYAARAGTTTKFYWGDDDAAAPVHAWFNANSGCQNIVGLFCEGGQTHPVGAKAPNAFGLYDITGNVWQWTADCYDNSYAGIPADGRTNQVPSSDPKAKDGQGNCLRVDRGGSWMFPAWLLRPATRERNPADYRNTIMGFRVARTLP